MADIRPFKGYRYSLAKPDDLGRLITPPYDMLDQAKINALYNSDELNAVRIDQNRAEQADAANRTRHERAAALFGKWVAGGAIRRDTRDSFYIYEQEFMVERAGRQEQRTRTGVICAVKLTEFNEGTVLPHEYTLSGPKIDRYEHLEITRLNVGQIFGLLDDPSGKAFELIGRMKKGPLAGTGTDADGVKHSLYCCDDNGLIDAFRETALPGTILIADGHHRYETALKFYHDHANDPANSRVMMTLVSTADPGLVIRSFHRVIRKGHGMTGMDFRAELGRSFTLTDCGTATLNVVNSFLQGGIAAEMLFVDSTTGRAFGCNLNDAGEAFLASSIPERSAAWKHLDMSKINMIAINRILGLPLDGAVLHDVIEYMYDSSAALEASTNSAEFHGGFFIRPVSLETIHRIVKSGERMPQKSTNFFPKLYSGLVFNKLGDA